MKTALFPISQLGLAILNGGNGFVLTPYWSMAERMKADLVIQALQQAHTLRQPQYGCVFHCDRGSQYTSRAFAKKISQLKMRVSMSDVGCCYDNAVVERFFGSLKQDGLGHTASMNEMAVKQEVTQFIITILNSLIQPTMERVHWRMKILR